MNLNFNINILRILYIFQIISLVIIIVLLSKYKDDLEWMNKSTTRIFYSFFILLIIIVFIPLILFIIILFKKTYHIFFNLLKISTLFFAIRLIFSCGFLILFIFNDKNLEEFEKYCPFSYSKEDLYLLFPNLNVNNITININNNELKSKCNNKRCYEFNGIDYICNYNSEKKLNREDDIKCNKIYNNNEENIGLYNYTLTYFFYINLCNSFVDFYRCNITTKIKKYSLEYDYICPENENNELIVLKIIIIVLNFFLPVCIYIMQFVYYKKILKNIVTSEIQRHNDTKSNKTFDSSNKIIKNKSSFKKEKTDVIVIDNNNNNISDNIIQVISKNKKMKTKKRIKIFKQDIFKKYQNSEKNSEKEFFENIGNRSFNQNMDINCKNNNDNIKTNRLLTAENKRQKQNEEIEDIKNVNYIIIKK